MSANLAALCYLVAAALFILALRGLSNPETSRRGNFFGTLGMAIAIATTLGLHPPASYSAWGLVALGMALGGGTGAVIARRVPMTSMPELVAAFHSLVGMAAVLVAAGALYAPAAFGIGTERAIHGQSLIEMSLGAAIGAVTFTGSVIPQARKCLSQVTMRSGENENWLVMFTRRPCALAAAIFSSSAASIRAAGMDG